MSDLNKSIDPQKSLTERVDLSFALQAAGLGVWELDTVTNQVQWDERCGELFGISQARKFAYQDTLQFIHPDDVKPVNQAIEQAMKPESGGNYLATYRTIGEDGLTRWIRSTGRSYFNQEGQVIRFAGVAQDVSQDVTMRHQQQASEAKFRSLIEEAPVATSLYTGPNMIIEVANEKMMGYWGKDHSVLGKPLAQALPELQGQPFLGLLDTIFTSGAVYQERAARADLVVEGVLTTFYFDYTYKPLRNEQGQIYAIMNTAIDVTEQVKAHRQLSESEARYRALSQALEQQVQERTVELATINKELIATLEELATTNEELTANNEEYAAINEELTASGEEVEQANKDLEETNRHLIRSNQNLEQFAYIASHDLQEPLRKIQQFGDLLKTRYVGSSGEDLVYLDRMQVAASRMSLLIKDLLTFSRISTSQAVLYAVALTNVIDDAIDTLSILIDESNATIHVGALPIVQGDASQLEQLFQNLLSNAIKFSRQDEKGQKTKPEIHIRASRILAGDIPASLRTTRAAAYHLIEVADNGIGFDEKYTNRIFQVFQRLHGRNEFAGTGVGLAICEKVVTNHGGVITATSKPGQGATFSVYLPV
ncbi:sensor histidine kinase [Spirosoma jeollabukense]